MIETLTVYLGSSGRCRDIFKNSAKRFGQIIGENDLDLVYGGMDTGLMGIVANEALAHDAHVTGIIPTKLKDSERMHQTLSERVLVADLWERKQAMFKAADAIIALPGGFGTIDEVLEALYWVQTAAHQKPVLFVNTDGYWDSFLAYLNSVTDTPHDHIIVSDSVEHVIADLKSWSPPSTLPHIDAPTYPHFEDDILMDTKTPLIFKEATISESYKLATALGLKQLDKHQRPIGLLNDKGQFDDLLAWIDKAQAETFVTDHCTDLFVAEKTADSLDIALTTQKKVIIDLHAEKWGASEDQPSPTSEISTGPSCE